MKRFEIFMPTLRIAVIGVGGGGNNAINRMIRNRVSGVQFVAVNTETLALMQSDAPIKVQLGRGGSGAGGDYDRAYSAACDSRDAIKQAASNADLVFIIACLGGGTGSGAAEVVAECAREAGALTVGVITHPFTFEGRTRLINAERGRKALDKHVDTLITVCNDRLLNLANTRTTLNSAFDRADGIIEQAIRTILEVVTVTGSINVDFADIRSVLSEGGSAMMSIGRGTGPNRAQEAAEKAIYCTVQNRSIDGARGVIFNITAHSSVTAQEVNEAARLVKERCDPNVNFYWGLVTDDSMDDTLQITLIATGCNQPEITVGRSLLQRKAADVQPQSAPLPKPVQQTTFMVAAEERAAEIASNNPVSDRVGVFAARPAPLRKGRFASFMSSLPAHLSKP